MNKKILFALAVLLVVGLYAYVYRDSFRSQPVQIFHRLNAARSRRWPWIAQNVDGPNVAFGLDQKLKLTDVQVISLATNATKFPLWHLVSASNSVPVKSFVYGQSIRGMTPFLPGTRPQPLEFNVPYRLLIQAGAQSGQHDFKIGD